MSAAAAAGSSRRFRPSLWATLFTVPAVLAMLALGTWQVERLHWKEALIQRVHDRLGSTPVPLPATIPNPDDFDLRPVTVTGRFLHERAMLVLARPRQGQVGYEVVTPFLRADGGPPVLVNRGWVPMDKRDAGRAGQGADDVTVHGVARLPVPPGWMQPDNQPGAEIWTRVDPPAMAASAGLPAVAPLVVEALPSSASRTSLSDVLPAPTSRTSLSDVLPAGIEPRVELPNNHLQYAVTWYSLAATLLIIYVLFHLRRGSDS
ncbi:MAG TPA: SURF1 family protein [Azospirillum sp.]|nr:SURF1 family protein [Azospirillum sp.]